MNVLIVLAHPEPQSFNAALKDKAVEVFTQSGHFVQVSDLYAMNFKAVADRSDFESVKNPDYLKYAWEQGFAISQNALSDDIKNEQAKILWADLIIFQFPVWWYSVPAILKGWFDRVLAYGFCYGPGIGVFEEGIFKQKKGLISLTTGGKPKPDLTTEADEFTFNTLYPINHGVFYFMGMQVLNPFVAYGAAGAKDEERKIYLEKLKDKILNINELPTIKF
jgi:NAD(P)H dehydrogenase (quinone)